MARQRGRSAGMAMAALLPALALGARGLGAAAAPPKACGECGSCNKKRCRNDDGCFYDAAARTCLDLDTDPCRGIQKKHGRKAPPEVGGRGELPGRGTHGAGLPA